MTLTAPGCPVAGDMPHWVSAAIESNVDEISEVIEPSVLYFYNVTEEVVDRLREDQANLEIIELEKDLIQAMNDESYVLENDNVLKDSFISVKRGSTLFPSDVLDNIFSSKLNFLHPLQ